jgi:hypothetical protein
MSNAFGRYGSTWLCFELQDEADERGDELFDGRRLYGIDLMRRLESAGSLSGEFDQQW